MRTLLGATIVVAWLGTLGWNAAREFRGRAATETRQLVARVGPGAGTFALTRDGAQVGLMLHSTDTIGPSVRITERWDLQLPDGRRMVVTDVAWLTRELELERFEVRRSGDAVPLIVAGTLVDDTTLVWNADRDGTTFSDTLRAEGPWTVPSALPLLGELLSPARKTAGVLLFEPLTFRRARIAAAATRDSTWFIADSTVYDSTTQRFSTVTIDTVPARLIAWTNDTLARPMWVDRTGVPVTLKGLFGTEAVRTADELARQDYRPRATAAPTGPSK